MTTTIKPIETVYRGFRFRSRLEARWAVFLDTLEIQFEYEKEGYDLGAAGWYLPDFWLPTQQCWVEIKPTYPDLDERRKYQALATGSGYDVLLFDRTEFDPPNGSRSSSDLTGMWARIYQPDHPENVDDVAHGFCFWTECTECMMDNMQFTRRLDGDWDIEWPSLHIFGIPGTMQWERHIRTAHPELYESVPDYPGCDETRALVDAYTAARQARFEHRQLRDGHGGTYNG